MRLKFILIGMLFLLCTQAFAELTVQEKHQKMLYPIVRINVNDSVAGTGTVVFSQLRQDETEKYSTYILTNEHVVDAAITIVDEYDNYLQKTKKVEKLAKISIEVFAYQNLSTPISAQKIDAEIVAYSKQYDVALVRLIPLIQIQYVAVLSEKDTTYVFDEVIAVGCSLGWPPLPSGGIITKKDYYMNAMYYDMASAPIIWGNSGGALFEYSTGQLVGIPSGMIALGGMIPVTHMAAFIPIKTIYTWLKNIHYEFIWDHSKTEEQCTKEREEDVKKKREE
jgi:S1-C subfamily serine protease